MSTIRQIAVFCCLVALALAAPRADSGGHLPLPAPGISYGGIPYGSMSGNVAEYFKQRSSGLNSNYGVGQQYL
ncbi:unnamed protein product [Pieris brassicae]|uniref:Uncharacterized protein n=1 Tax=Pieris brassicae TaxID=7116 RepID=A0A9P0T256_PIEBR|nr:unnamed protein product [Pieris brassicae]